MSKEQYPEDEFDVLGAQRAPKGVHREPEAAWTKWLPYLLVVLLVPLLTFGAVKLFSTEPESEPSASESADDADADTGDGDNDSDAEGTEGEDPQAGNDGDDADEDDAETPPEEPTEDPAEDPEDGEPSEEPTDLNYGTRVLVLNGAGIQGFAAQVADALAAQGWADTVPDNYANAEPATTTLYYTSAEIEAEAQAVARDLGITNLVESASAAPNGIVIVLRPDFTLP